MTAVPVLAAEKAIWGPLTLPSGADALAIYDDLGVDTLQMELEWNLAAPKPPAAPRDPRDPAYRWPTEVERALNQVRARGIRLALLVAGTPAWANGGRSRIWAPTSPTSLGDFVAAASRRYPGVRRWMIYGEPNMAVRFQPQQADSGVSARAYAPLLDAAYAALKRVNRRNVVIGGMTWTGGDVKPARFVRELRLPSGRPPRLDWFGHNPYPYRRPRLSAQPLGEYRDISDIDTFGDEVDRAYRGRRRGPVPLWLSEFMIQSDRPSFAFATHVSQRSQAAWLREGLRIADRLGPRVRGIGWFGLLDQPSRPGSANWGLLTSDGTPKPAFAAFRDAPSQRLAPGVRVAPSVRRGTLGGRGITVVLSLRTRGQHTVQLRRGGCCLAIRRVRTSHPPRTRRVRLRRTGIRAGRLTIRVLSPRGSTVTRTLRVR